ncbi:hypothetical protein P4S72_08835 [Vibrio sp. PP-XX7]
MNPHDSAPGRLRHLCTALLGDKLALFALVIFVFHGVIALLAPLLSPYNVHDPRFMDLAQCRNCPLLD